VRTPAAASTRTIKDQAWAKPLVTTTLSAGAQVPRTRFR
jgi:hypothetical protein